MDIFELRGGENNWAKCHGGVRFPLGVYVLIRIVFNHEGISGTSEAGVRQKDELLSWNGLFDC